VEDRSSKGKKMGKIRIVGIKVNEDKGGLGFSWITLERKG
jgi:hypothetical protein